MEARRAEQPKLNGGHVLAIFVGAFSIIIGVNVLMATLAVQTFPGLWAKNSYVASQNYNRLLKDAHVQAGRNWKASVTADNGVVIIDLVDATGTPMRGLRVQAIAARPASEAEDTPFPFAEFATGYRSTDRLASGRWILDIDAYRGDELIWRDTRPLVIERRD